MSKRRRRRWKIQCRLIETNQPNVECACACVCVFSRFADLAYFTYVSIEMQAKLVDISETKKFTVNVSK